MPKTNPKRDSLKHLTRMDSEAYRGWRLWMSASATKTGEQFMMYFGDVEFGGSEAALNAARVQREHLMYRGRQGKHVRTTSRARAQGLPTGVRLAIERRNGSLGVSWVALWMRSGKQLRRSFGCVVHGYEEGFEKARALRQKMSGFDLSEYTCLPMESLLSEEDCLKLRVAIETDALRRERRVRSRTPRRPRTK